ncbi:MAG: hypothetical protein KJO78_11580 [Alphaproteobacteria bacterium]|nr:hypothetical protein [Alphaproteobacteria bacterium]
MAARALLIGVDPDEAATLRFRDRIIAAGIPLLLIPLLAIVLVAAFRPAGNSAWAILQLVAFSLSVTLPTYPVVVLTSYWFSKRGLIGALPFLGAGAALGTVASSLLLLLVFTEVPVKWDEALLTLMSWAALGAVYAGIAWLSLLVLRIDLYFDLSEDGADGEAPRNPPSDSP